MITVRDWGPQGIANVCAAAVRVAFRRMRRSEATGEAFRLRCWFGDDYRRDLADIVVRSLDKGCVDAPARQVLRELANIVMVRHLKAEIGSRTKGKR